MFIVRNVFQTKPGKAKELVKTLKNALQYMPDVGVKSTKILTDVSATFWTVVLESEVENLNAYVDMSATASSKPEFGEAMKGYMDLVTEGYRKNA